MSRAETVFDRLSGKVFSIANNVTSYIGINGATAAVAVNAFPETPEKPLFPYAAINVRSNGRELESELEERLLNRVHEVIHIISRGEENEPFDAIERSGLILTIESNCRRYAYVILAIELPPEVGHIEIDEVSLIRDIVQGINEGMPHFSNKDGKDLESDPVVKKIYGTIIDSRKIHSYVLSSDDE